MKICLVNTLFTPFSSGGTEVVVKTTIDLLLQQGHQVVLITTKPDQTTERWSVESNQGFTIYRFRPRNLYYYTDGGRQPVWKKMLWHAVDLANPFDKSVITSILVKEKPDLVHGHNLKGMSYTLPGICARIGVPYVHTLHNYQLLHPYGTFLYTEHPPYWRPKILAKFYQLLNRIMFRTVRHVISPSTLPLQLHQQAGFFASASCNTLPSPVIKPQGTDTYQPGIVPRFVYLGAIEDIKGIRVLLKALQGLADDAYQLDIFGEGSLRAELEKQTKTMTAVRWLGRLTKMDKLGTYDALIYPSICFETQGLSMAVALSGGTPVIASRIGSIPETVMDGQNGLLFTAGQADELRRLLMACIDQPNRLSDLRLNAMKGAERFNLDKYTQKLTAVYQTARES